MKRFVFFSLFIFVPLFGQIKTKFPVTVYTVNDGLAQSVVYGLYQDKHGYLWLGTQAGISRFDGKNFENFDTTHGISHNTIRAITQIDDGRILLATEHGITQFDGLEFSILPDLTGYHPKSIRQIIQAGDGTLWGTSFDAGVFQYKDGKYHFFNDIPNLPKKRARAIDQDSLGRIWVGYYGGGLAFFQDEQWHIVETDEQHRQIRTLEETDSGHMLVGTNTGVYIVRDNLKLESFSEDHRLQGSITAITRGREGDLWFGTNQYGVVHINGNLVEAFNISNGLSNNGIQSIFQDNEGKMWFGTYGGGVCRIGQTQFQNITSQGGFAYDNVYALFQDQDGVIWLGTNGGGVTKLEKERIRHFDKNKGLIDDKVLTINQDSKGRLWIGTLMGVNYFEGDEIRTLTTTDGLPHNIAYHILPLEDGRVFIGTIDGLAIFDEGNITIVCDSDGMNHNRVNHIHRHHNGEIWLATASGISVYHQGRIIRNFTKDNGLQAEYVNHLMEDSKNRIWISTTEGVICYDKGNFTHYTTKQGLSSPRCNVAIEDRKGMIWIGTANGLNRFDGENFAIFTHRDGIPSNEINRNASLLDRTGNLWFGTTTGATRFLTADPVEKLPAPNVNITGVKVMGKPQIFPFKEPLKPWENYLEVNFNGISFSDAENIRFAYRLIGLDDTWIPTQSTDAVFLNLPPGSYRFSVKARNSDGLWSESHAELPFEIKPPFWQKPWFIPVLAILFLVLIWLQLRRLKQRNLRLEAIVNERTEELEKLALWDQLTGVRNRHYLNLIMPSEMAKLKRDFYAAVQGFADQPQSLGIAMMDIDHFKIINDSFGHEVGDTVLAELSKRLKNFIRESDTLTRWGGEEFLLILPRIDFHHLTKLCDRLRRKISEEPLELASGKKIHLNISIGFTIFPLDHDPMDYDWKKLINLADIALYQAKRRGRNMVVGFNPEGYLLKSLFDMVETDVESAPDYMAQGLIFNPYAPTATS